MALEVTPATGALMAATEEWLDEEEIAYEAGGSKEEASGWAIDQSPRGFRCNWDMVKRSWQAGDGSVHILTCDGRSVGFLWNTDILEVMPQERGLGYGRLLAEFMVKRAFDEGRSVIEIEIAPRSAIPFWQRMGFTLVDGRLGAGGGCYAYQKFERRFPLGTGPLVPCSVEFFTEEERFGRKASFYSFEGLGELLPSSFVQLPERAVCFTPKAAQGDPFARITVDGKEIFYDKMKRPEGAQCGIQRDAGHTYFIERLRIS